MQRHRKLPPPRAKPSGITDGVKLVSDLCGAYWLIDSILLKQHLKAFREQEFQIWMPDIDSKVAALKFCETCEFNMGRTSLPLDGAGEDRITGFTCGCCGRWFTSTIIDQERFDQDEGYGICETCDNRYDDWRNK